MGQYTVRALENLLKASPRDYVTRKELITLKTRFIKLAERGAAEGVTAQNHRAWLDNLLQQFPGKT